MPDNANIAHTSRPFYYLKILIKYCPASAIYFQLAGNAPGLDGEVLVAAQRDVMLSMERRVYCLCLRLSGAVGGRPDLNMQLWVLQVTEEGLWPARPRIEGDYSIRVRWHFANVDSPSGAGARIDAHAIRIQSYSYIL